MPHETISPQGFTVLRALAAAEACSGRSAGLRDVPAGELNTAELVRCVARRGTAISVTRASLSRTLRRLWRMGLVELTGSSWWKQRTMTEHVSEQQQELVEIEADPESAYQQHRTRLEGLPDLVCDSVDTFIARKQQRLQRLPFVRVTRVSITVAGRKAVNSSAAPKLTGPKGSRQKLTGRKNKTLGAKLTGRKPVNKISRSELTGRRRARAGHATMKIHRSGTRAGG